MERPVTAARAVDPQAILRRLLDDGVIELNEWRPRRLGPRGFAELAPDLREDAWSIGSPERPGLLDISQAEHDYLLALQQPDYPDIFIVAAGSFFDFYQAMRKARLNPRHPRVFPYTGEDRQVQGLPEGTAIYGLDPDLNLVPGWGHIHNRRVCNVLHRQEGGPR